MRVATAGALAASGLAVPAGGAAGATDVAGDRTGEVVGTVVLTVDAGSPPPMLSPYARRRYRPPAAAPSGGASPEDVVVYLEVGGRRAAGRRAAITQRNRTILPHVTAIQVGTTIDFPNEDEVFHNLFSLSDTKRFNLGRYAPGDSRQVTFEEAGVVRMFCDIHSEMSGTILVLDTPHFTRPGPNGEFRLTGVPDGRHTLVAWHESAGSVTTEVTVSAGRVARVSIRLPD